MTSKLSRITIQANSIFARNLTANLQPENGSTSDKNLWFLIVIDSSTYESISSYESKLHRIISQQVTLVFC